MEWELYKKYKMSLENQENLRRQNREKFNNWRRELADISQEYQHTLMRQYRGDEVDERKKELEEKAKDLRDKLRSLNQVESNDLVISTQKLIDDWNGNILPKIRSERLEQINNNLIKARYAYYKYLNELYCVHAEYQEIIDELNQRAIEEASLNRREYNSLEPLFSPDNLPLIKPDHINYIRNNREVPEEVKEEFINKFHKKKE